MPLINYAAQTNRPAAQIDALVERARASQPYPPPPELWSTWLAALAQLERYDLLEGLCQDLGALARRRGSLEESAVVAAMRAWGLHDTGALADAESEAMWAAGRSRGVVRWIGLKTLLPVLIERDELDEAEAVLSRFGEPPASTAVPVLAFHAARGRMRAAQGRLREGLADLMACGQPARRVGAVGGDRNWRSHAALILHALGDAEQARRLSTEDVALARMFGRPRTLGIALRADGMVSDGEQRVARLANAVAVLERAHAPVELARARADYGVALRRSGQRIEARAQIEQALDLAHHCGARRIARSARAELVALGAKPRRDAVTGRDALTASELRVARLAAQGMSNREIAQALFITHKTASVHLSRIYRKLGIGRRDQLVTELARQSPTGTAGPAQYDRD